MSRVPEKLWGQRGNSARKGTIHHRMLSCSFQGAIIKQRILFSNNKCTFILSKFTSNGGPIGSPGHCYLIFIYVPYYNNFNTTKYQNTQRKLEYIEEFVHIKCLVNAIRPVIHHNDFENTKTVNINNVFINPYLHKQFTRGQFIQIFYSCMSTSQWQGKLS